jgi:hypothetical protein
MLALMRLRLLVPLVTGAVLLGLAPSASADPGPTPYGRRLTDAGPVAKARQPITVGALTLKPCQVMARAYCGHIERNWEPGNPSAGQVHVGFAFVLMARMDA